jgi:hypothetical protein
MLTTTFNGSTYTIKPGDFASVRTHNPVTLPIYIGEILNEYGPIWNRRRWDYEHSITYLGVSGQYAIDLLHLPAEYLGQDLILEAEAAGAVVVPFHYDESDLIWSSLNPHLDLSPDQQHGIWPAAAALKGIPYSWLDYFALAAHRMRLHPLDYLLKTRIMSWRQAICSQLVDMFRQRLHFQLFNDDRWNGFVDPFDIAECIVTYGGGFPGAEAFVG